MKTALVCIAKNEDHYIDEWITYHTKLGFDYIYVYQNNWRYSGNKQQFNNVHWIEFDGEAKQLESYDNFIKHQLVNYDWAAFFDVDEFLCFKTYTNVKSFLKNYNEYNAIGINWRLFGNNSQTHIINNNYSLLNRFTMAEYIQNIHIKTIIHNKNINNIRFIDPHSIANSLTTDFTINTKKTKFINGPFNYDFDTNVQLNHYYSKTLEEFINIKLKRGRSDVLLNNTNISEHYDIQKFSMHNKNDVEDLTAKNFYLSNI